MKFGHKLTLVISTFLCVALSLGGAWTIEQNFAQARKDLLRQSSRQQLYARYALETAFSRTEEEPAGSLSGPAARYAREQKALTTEAAPAFAVFGEKGAVLYSDIPHSVSYADQQQAIRAGETGARFLHTDSGYVLLLTTPLRGLDRPLWLVSAYDATGLFRERDRQLRQHLLLQAAALLLTGAAASLVSRMMTRSLQQLESASLALSEGKRTTRVSINSRDELEQLGHTFNSMADALEGQISLLQEESERQKRFVAAFTHELKTPMTAILGYAGLLHSAELPPERRRKAAGYIYHESARLEALSRELLLLLGLEKGEILLQPVAVSAVYEDVRRSLPEPSFHLEWQGEKSLRAQADRVLLATLLRNLVLNAAAAEPRDGRVTVRCDRCEEGIRLCVEDRGRGIPPQELARVTEPFYRVDKSRSREKGGNGLGLSICAEIARLHGDTLRLDSKEKEGTRAWVVLKEAET